MTQLHVITHQLEEDGGLYRLVVGEAVEHLSPLTDDDGNVMLDDDGEAMTETRVEYVTVEDFAFAADDPRWEGKTPEQVAKKQRQLVKKLLADREQEAVAPAAEELPGVGDPL